MSALLTTTNYFTHNRHLHNLVKPMTNPCLSDSNNKAFEGIGHDSLYTADWRSNTMPCTIENTHGSYQTDDKVSIQNENRTNTFLSEPIVRRVDEDFKNKGKEYHTRTTEPFTGEEVKQNKNTMLNQQRKSTQYDYNITGNPIYSQRPPAESQEKRSKSTDDWAISEYPETLVNGCDNLFRSIDDCDKVFRPSNHVKASGDSNLSSASSPSASSSARQIVSSVQLSQTSESLINPKISPVLYCDTSGVFSEMTDHGDEHMKHKSPMKVGIVSGGSQRELSQDCSSPIDYSRCSNSSASYESCKTSRAERFNTSITNNTGTNLSPGAASCQVKMEDATPIPSRQHDIDMTSNVLPVNKYNKATVARSHSASDFLISEMVPDTVDRSKSAGSWFDNKMISRRKSDVSQYGGLLDENEGAKVLTMQKIRVSEPESDTIPSDIRGIQRLVVTRRESTELPSAEQSVSTSPNAPRPEDPWNVDFSHSRYSVSQVGLARENDPRASMSESYGFCSSSSPMSTWSRDYDPVFCQAQCQNCVVCGELANGNFFGAVVCLPCKSFFIRCTKDGEPCIIQQCGGTCDITKQLRNRCQYCRYQQCLAVGMSRKEKPECIQPQEGQELCKVCGDLANGIHFGVYTCEGCKKFFRRGLKEHMSYICKDEKHCRLNPRNRNNCRFCRYQKCLVVGMSREAIKMGRPRKLYPNRSMSGVISSIEIPMTLFSPYSRDRTDTSPFYHGKECSNVNQTEMPSDFRASENYRATDGSVWYNKSAEDQRSISCYVRSPSGTVEIPTNQTPLLPRGHHGDLQHQNSFVGIPGHVSKSNQSLKEPTDLRRGHFPVSLSVQSPFIQNSALAISNNRQSPGGLQIDCPQNSFDKFQHRELETATLSDAQTRCPEQLAHSVVDKNQSMPNPARQLPFLSGSKCSNEDYMFYNRSHSSEYIKAKCGQAIIPQNKILTQPSKLISSRDVPPPPLIMHPAMNSLDIKSQSGLFSVQTSTTFPHQSSPPPLMQMGPSTSASEAQRTCNNKETEQFNSQSYLPPLDLTREVPKVTESSHRFLNEKSNISVPFENKSETLALDLTVNAKLAHGRIYSFPNNFPESYLKNEPQSLETEAYHNSGKRNLELAQRKYAMTVLEKPDHTAFKIPKIEEYDQMTATSAPKYQYKSHQERMAILNQNGVNWIPSTGTVPKIPNFSMPSQCHSPNNISQPIIHRPLMFNSMDTCNNSIEISFIKQEIPESWDNGNFRNPLHAYDSSLLTQGRRKQEQAEDFTVSLKQTSESKPLNSEPSNSFSNTQSDVTSLQIPMSRDVRHQTWGFSQTSPSSHSGRRDNPTAISSLIPSLQSATVRPSAPVYENKTKEVPINNVDNDQEVTETVSTEKRRKKGFDPYTNQQTLIYINEMFQVVDILTDSINCSTDRQPREKILAELEVLDGMFSKVDGYSPLQVTQFWQNLSTTAINQDLEKDKPILTPDLSGWLENITKGYANQVTVCDEDINPPSVDMNNHEVWPPQGEDTNHWKHFQERVARQTYAEAQFLLLLPDIDKIHPKDRVKLGNNTRLFGNTILMASREWFDPVRKKFKFFWNWKLSSENLLSPFRNSIIKTGSRIFNLHMDQKEVAILSALNIMSSENGSFHNLEQINGHTQALLKVLCHYLQSINVDPDDRIPELLATMPKIRHLSMWYSNLIRNMRVDPSSIDKTLQDLTLIASKATIGERVRNQSSSDKDRQPSE